MTDTPTPLDAADRKPPFVLVLVPSAESVDPSIEYYTDYSQNHGEFARAFDALGLSWRWQPVTSRNFREVIDAEVAELGANDLVVFNLCDGDESNDVPGVGVIHHLDALGIPYTGADADFYQGTTSKIDMKHAFDAAGVSTAPWRVIDRGARITKTLFSKLGTPLIVKPAVSAGSMGITIKSVVGDSAALREQVAQLHEGYHGWDLVSGGVLVERFIAGPEFTTFIVGSAADPERAMIYPPIERIFHRSLPATEQFLSYDRLWEVHERESPVGNSENLWEYEPAPTQLREQIEALSWSAYAAVGGHGYGRVDLRMDATTGELFVLEVNAQCGLSEDENYTSIGAILRYAGSSFAEMVQAMLDRARVERPEPRPLVPQ
jgi:D-alanine-D-alanine ligase